MKSPARLPRRSSPNTKKRNTGKNNINLNFKTILVNFSQLAFGEFSSKAFGFLTTLYLARMLGAEGLGMYGFVSAVSAYAILFSNFGIEQYSMQRFSSLSEPVSGNMVETVIGTRVYLSTFFIALFTAFGIMYSRTDSELYLFLFQGIFILAFAFNPQFYFIAMRKLKHLSAVKTGTAIFILSSTLLYVTSPVDLPKVTLINGVVTLVFFLLAAAYIFSGLRKRARIPRINECINLLRNAAPLGISAFMIQIYKSADIVMLGFINPGIELGYYTGVYRIIAVLSIIPGFFYFIFLPDLSKISSGFFSTNITRRYIAVQIASGLSIAFVCYIASEELISLLLGSEYLPAVDVFSVLLINVFLIFVNVSFGQLLIAWNRHKEYLVVVASGAVINIVCNIVLIPAYSIMGAAVATVCAEVAVLIVALYYHRTLHGLFATRKTK